VRPNKLGGTRRRRGSALDWQVIRAAAPDGPAPLAWRQVRRLTMSSRQNHAAAHRKPALLLPETDGEAPATAAKYVPPRHVPTGLRGGK